MPRAHSDLDVELEPDPDFEEDEEEEDDGAEVYPVGVPPQRRMPPPAAMPVVDPDRLPSNAMQLRVTVDDSNGRSAELGYVHTGASWDDIIQRWHQVVPSGGTFRFWAVDLGGKVLWKEPYVAYVHPGHEAYAKVRASAPQVVQGPNGSQVLVQPQQDSHGWAALLEQQRLDAQERKAREERERLERIAERKAIEEEKARIRDMEAQLARDRIALAAETSASSTTLLQTIIEKNASDKERSIELLNAMQTSQTNTLVGFLTAQMAQQEKAWAEERQRRNDELKAERDRLRFEAEEREKRAKAEIKEREQAHIQALERDRAFHEKQVALVQAASKGDDFGKMVAKGIGLAKTLGIDLQGVKITDVLGMFAGGPASTLDIGLKIVDKVVDGVVEVQKMRAQEDDDEEEAPEPGTELVDVKFSDGRTVRMTRADYEAMLSAQQQQQAPAQIPQQQPGVPGQVQPQFQHAPGGFVAPGAGAPPAPQAPQAPAQNQGAPPAIVNPADALPAPVQKKARSEAKQLVALIRKHEHEEDDEVFGTCIMVELGTREESPELDQYCRVVGVDVALRDAGLPTGPRERVIRLLTLAQASGDFPADVPLKK